ncbi:MAG TPA: hypothetical protein VGL56_13570 [Fimbriimonadaceae bacterium]|jgi:hypothetical protein
MYLLEDSRVLLNRSHHFAGFGGTAPIQSPADVNAALSWLPADTEAVVVCNRPGKLDLNPEGRPKLAECISQLGAVGMPDYLKVSYDFILDGSRKYGYPKQLGVGKYEGCKIVALEPAERQRLQHLLATKAVRTAVLDGLPVRVKGDVVPIFRTAAVRNSQP